MPHPSADPVRGVCWSGILVFAVLVGAVAWYAVWWCFDVARAAVRWLGG